MDATNNGRIISKNGLKMVWNNNNNSSMIWVNQLLQYCLRKRWSHPWLHGLIRLPHMAPKRKVPKQHEILINTITYFCYSFHFQNKRQQQHRMIDLLYLNIVNQDINHSQCQIFQKFSAFNFLPEWCFEQKSRSFCSLQHSHLPN